MNGHEFKVIVDMSKDYYGLSVGAPLRWMSRVMVWCGRLLPWFGLDSCGWPQEVVAWRPHLTHHHVLGELGFFASGFLLLGRWFVLLLARA